MKSATAAPEPDDEPPGVCAKLCGLRVSALRPPAANSTVSVLPRMSAPDLAHHRHARRVLRRPVIHVMRRVLPGRHVAGVDHVFHAERQPVQRARRRAACRARAPARSLAADRHTTTRVRSASRSSMRARHERTSASHVSVFSRMLRCGCGCGEIAGFHGRFYAPLLVTGIVSPLPRHAVDHAGFPESRWIRQSSLGVLCEDCHHRCRDRRLDCSRRAAPGGLRRRCLRAGYDFDASALPG